MRRTTISVAAGVAGLIAVPAVASALTAVTTEPVALRAGPAIDFPVVDRIPDDARVNVHGCIRAYAWCDISWRSARGWVPGEDLAYLHERRHVPIVEYGPRVGLPIIAFSVGSYWDRHYRGRSWYGRRAHWNSVWRDRHGGDGRAEHRPDRRDGRVHIDRREGKVDQHPRGREGKVDRHSEGREGRVDRRKHRAERRLDRQDHRADRRLDRRDGNAEHRPNRVQRMGERRGHDAGAAPRHDAAPGRVRPEASVRERPSGRPGATPEHREGGGGPGGDGGPRNH